MTFPRFVCAKTDGQIMMLPSPTWAQLYNYTLTQEYVLTKRLLRWMLKRNPEERATLSEILQDSELRKALENPLDGRILYMWYLLHFKCAITNIGLFFFMLCRTLVRHLWEDDLIWIFNTLCILFFNSSQPLPFIYHPEMIVHAP